MTQSQRLTAIIEREDDGFVSLCPELDIAGQGASIGEARANLLEASRSSLRLPARRRSRYHGEVFVTELEVPVG